MKKGLTVLSLFDGMSCGQIALRKIGLPLEKYYASEVDRHAIAQTMLNFPETLQLGDVTKINPEELGKIDILIGGSPCQSFSFAGKRNGMATTENEEIYTLERYIELKGQGFEFEGQSYLFWEYIRILTELRKRNPEIKFLLENVKMQEKWEKVLSKAIGVPPTLLDSKSVSAQRRQRLYWTNIYYRLDPDRIEEDYTIPPLPEKGIILKDILCQNVPEKYILSHLNDKPRKLTANYMQLLETYFDSDYRFWYDTGSHGTLLAKGVASTGVYTEGTIRRLTPTECSRLQTIPDWYRWGCSEAQQYKMLGNGWTVDVIAHIFAGIKC
ncbi:DNA cytosine methyltransferase [Bacteroides sedimenti]|uniref:DNA (cytosine-5-)-methyltransferase n=1 Tax=Bacteroides sedimenti TaxID=2136147 RepID=A0ABM8I7P4_9BACE